MVWNPQNGLLPPGSRARTRKRPQRVADLVKNEISLLLLRKSKDPRLLNVTIVEVIVSKDLRRAKVFYSVIGNEQKVQQAAAGLKSAKGFIRSHLARELDLRVTPELVFQHDLSLARQEEINNILKELESEDRPSE